MYLELEDDFFVWYNILILFENDFKKNLKNWLVIYYYNKVFFFYFILD